MTDTHVRTLVFLGGAALGITIGVLLVVVAGFAFFAYGTPTEIYPAPTVVPSP